MGGSFQAFRQGASEAGLLSWWPAPLHAHSSYGLPPDSAMPILEALQMFKLT